MNWVITCSVKEATRLMEHLNEDDMVTLTIIDKKAKIVYEKPKRIKKRKGEKLLKEADVIEYQDNDFFGRLSFHSRAKENIVQNILFPQLE